ncbi:MAG: Omp28-related outer membrane protein [Saprospiraceae bacterium]|nr:Omp28-related outer membrane protein [Saprospiraceae bacterium]
MMTMDFGKTVFVWTIVLCAGLFSCSEWERPILLKTNVVDASQRVVVIEEFTGMSCVNCPTGIAISNAIADIYPDNVVLIAIHSKFLGQPATKGQTDLRVPDAQAVEDFLGSWLAKPEAAINRLYSAPHMGYRIGNPDSWKSLVEAELLKDPEVDLRIQVNFHETSRTLRVQLEGTARVDIAQPIHLHCGITQSGIIADQLDNATGKLVNFEHRHALLKVLSPVSGDRMANSLKSGEKFSKEYQFVLPVDSVLWKPEDCQVFGFASRDENEKYILQAAEAPVK